MINLNLKIDEVICLSIISVLNFDKGALLMCSFGDRWSIFLIKLGIIFPIVSLELSIVNPLLSLKYGELTAKNLEEGAQHANAESDKSFQDFIQMALKAYKHQKYSDAIVFFKRAMNISPDPNIHWNLAVTYQKTKDFKRALYHIDEYLKVPNLEDKKRAKVNVRREKIVSALQKERTDEVRVARHYDPQTKSNSDPSNTKNKKEMQTSNFDPLSNDVSAKRAWNSQSKSNRTWLVWGASGLSLIAIGTGVHLYANTIWQGRNLGSDSVTAQEDAITVSWIGDGMLLLGGGALTYGIYSFFTSPPAHPTYKSPSENRDPNTQNMMISLPTFFISENGGGLIWRGFF